MAESRRSYGLFLLLLFLECVSCCTASKMLYVRTDKNINPCQNRTPCCTLTEYASNSTSYFNSNNTELIFLPGVHHLKEKSILLQSLNNIIFRADALGEKVEIVCVTRAILDSKQYFGFSFQDVTNLEINGLIFTGCSVIKEANNSYFSHVSAGLYMREITNLTLNKITVQNSTGYGLLLCQIYGISNIRNSIFQHNSALDNTTNGGNVMLIYQKATISATTILTIEKTKILHGKSASFASGLLIMLYCSGIQVHIIEMELTGNQAQPTKSRNCKKLPTFGGNLGLLLHDYDSSRNKCTAGANSTEITVLNTTISSGQACYGGGVFANFTSSYNTENEVLANLLIANLMLVKNKAQISGAAIFMQMNSQMGYTNKSQMQFRNCTMTGNQLLKNSFSGVAMTVTSLAVGVYHLSPILTIIECRFFNNLISTEGSDDESTPKYAAALFVSQCTDGLHVHDTRFDSNAVGAISLIHSSLTVSGEVVITNNTGYIGGGLALREVSYLIFTAETNLTISYNHASFKGGGIFVHDEPLMLQNEPCFYQNYSGRNAKIKLIGNSAAYGSQLYGGRIETCVVKNEESRNFSEIFELASGGDNISPISSDPEEIRFCHNNTPDFNSRFIALDPVYSGETFDVSVAFIGQHGGITHGKAHFFLGQEFLSDENHLIAKPPHQAPSISREICVTYSIQIFTTNNSEQLEIKSLSATEHIGNVFLNVSIKSTPLGFVSTGNTTSPPYRCIKRPHLSAHHFKCSISNHEAIIERWPPYWLGYSNSTGEVSYVLYRYCPVHYCYVSNLSLRSNSEEIVLDEQCANHHSGVLCGQCKPGLSLALGSSACLNCSHISLGESIGIAVGMASIGVIFIFSLYFFNLATTFQGKLNGFHFYMNVIYVYWKQLHRESAPDITYAFVSFANLVFGCNCCFYDGLSMIGRTWLQFFLVVYLWCLVGVIILASKYFKWINKWKGDHTVPVLALIMDLSHTSLSLAVIHSLSAAQLTYYESNTNSTFTHIDLVLFYDGNIRYFHKMHIPLFIAGCIFGIIGTCYLFLVLCVQPLQKYSNFVLLRWVNHLKPFFDACTHPHVAKYQFWNGFLWLARALTYFIYATGIGHYDTHSLDALSIICLIVFLTHVGLGGTYTKRSLNFTFAFYVLNLFVMSIVVRTRYASERTTLQPQRHIAKISTAFIGSAILVFLVTVVSHFYNRVKKTTVITLARKKMAIFLNRRGRHQYQALEPCVENSNKAAISTSSSLGTPQNIHPPLSTTYREPQLRDYDSI